MNNIVDIILDKRYGRELSSEQIDFFVKGVTDGSIPDYQISALLMAIVLNGMTDRETTDLTMKMAYSGHVNDLSYIDGIAVDKHSTGGVGDKITPIVMPLCASFGVQIAKLSGRGLGFTGGTVDKFKSISGFECQIDVNEFPELIKKCGMVISSQTPDLAPADRILYQLRDVTGTVDSIPLIASSIMSKKIAGGASAIVLDVTCGSGAFMKDIEHARMLSEAMIRIGENAGRKTVAFITDMDQPLGRTCGNVLEMREVFDTLRGKGSPDVVEVACNIAAKMVELGGKGEGRTFEELVEECRKRLEDNTALTKFYELLLSQGGSIRENGVPDYREESFEVIRIPSPEEGYISKIRADIMGHASVLLGAGRLKKGDKLDYGAGLCFYAKVGDHVHKGDLLCSLCRGASRQIDDDKLYDIMDLVLGAYQFSPEPVERNKAVIDMIG
ncbi:MAG TPA: thymidine phosphorylase [Clostridiales bacterium]|nr:thymidine phosphorylase [Clostridiales bacterium]